MMKTTRTSKKTMHQLSQDLPGEVKSHIERLERVRQDFVANVSHELRTPLTVIRGYLETLLMQEHEATDALKKIFMQMHEHSVRMESIIDDLLFLSRLENEEQHFEMKKSINIANMLKTLCFDAKKVSGERQHEITLDADTSVLLDGYEDELKSLFSNIIINAVKYTPEQGKITVAWGKKSGKAIFSVTDTGIGIAKKHIPRITERFYRVDKGRSRASGGTGLGLAIAKHVLLHHHGELKISSRIGSGSTFSCIFPKKLTASIKPD